MDYNQIVADLFQFRDQIHLWHLQTDSYATHMALNSFYDDINSQLDRFIEVSIAHQYTFDCDKLDMPGFTNYNLNIVIEVISQYIIYIESMKEQFLTGAMQNILDDMAESSMQTLYLLRLK